MKEYRIVVDAGHGGFDSGKVGIGNILEKEINLAIARKVQENLEAAGAIVREQMDEFFQWLDGRDLIPRIQEIKEEAVHDLNLRIAKILKKTPMEEDDRENLTQAVNTAAGKVVNKLIFGLRDSLNQEAFLECVAGLEKIYEE